MALNWNEVRAKAAAFAERHKYARYEKGETHTFYNEFFRCFGVDRMQVAVYEKRVKNLPGDKQGFIDLLMPGKLIIEQKSAGLGHDFLQRVEAKFGQIAESPQHFRLRVRSYRLAATERFPYAIYFIWDEANRVVTVRRLLHFKQDSRPRI